LAPINKFCLFSRWIQEMNDFADLVSSGEDAGVCGSLNGKEEDSHLGRENIEPVNAFVDGTLRAILYTSTAGMDSVSVS
jgi:hypothetical protein